MYYGSNPPQRRTSVVTKKIAPMSQLAQRHPLHPLMVVIGVLIVALTVKIGHCAHCGCACHETSEPLPAAADGRMA